jgi:hypothetical protein
MLVTEILSLTEFLSHLEKFQLVQSLLTQLAKEEGFFLPAQVESANQGERMANILQRMADRQALSHITDPMLWQREIRADKPLLDRE